MTLLVAKPRAAAPRTATARDPLTPIFRFNGGKRALVPYVERGLRAALQRKRDTSTYYEPFCGGAAVALAINWPRSCLSDASPHVVETCVAVRDGAAGVWRHLQDLARATPADDSETRFTLPTGRSARGPVFHAARRAHAAERDPARRAALFLYLMARGFNGLLRVSRRTGALNVPCGDVQDPAYPTLAQLEALARAASAWQFLEEDFERTCARARAGDVLVLDPPYDGVFAQYTREGFSWQDQERLAAVAARARRAGVTVVGFNADTPRIRALWRKHGFRVLPTRERNAITRDGATRGRRRPSVILAGDLALVDARGEDTSNANAGRRPHQLRLGT